MRRSCKLQVESCRLLMLLAAAVFAGGGPELPEDEFCNHGWTQIKHE